MGDSRCGLCGGYGDAVCVDCYMIDYNEIVERIERLEEKIRELEQRTHALENRR